MWHTNLSESNLVSQVVPQVSELCERFLYHVSVCLVSDLLEQQLPLVAQLLHIDLLLVHFHLVLLFSGKVEKWLISSSNFMHKTKKTNNERDPNLEFLDLLFDSAEVSPHGWHVTQFDDSIVQVVKHALRPDILINILFSQYIMATSAIQWKGYLPAEHPGTAQMLS